MRTGHLHIAVERGLLALRARQLADGSWPDFELEPGVEGTEWTTGYIGAELSEMPQARNEPWRSMLTQARRYLLRTRRPEGGWGFCAAGPLDADSTAWCLLCLLANPAANPEDFRVEFEELCRHNCSCGDGFITYRWENTQRFGRASAYYAASPCVTATVILALRRDRSLDFNELIRRSCDYLRRTQEPEGWWASIWWQHGIYATALAARALSSGSSPPVVLDKSRQWLQATQNRDGSWGGPGPTGSNAFLTSLALRALLDLGVSAKDEIPGRAIEWLVATQCEDGSWEAPPIMKLPAVDPPPAPDESAGLRLIAGHRRSFVTATVVAALARIARPSNRSAEGLQVDPPLHDPTFDEEILGVVAEFDAWVGALPGPVQSLAQQFPAWARRGTGISHYLPFWLADALAAGSLCTQARAMALANRFGQFFCLLQDGLLDQDSGANSAGMILLDALFFRFLHDYQHLFPATHPFWTHFEHYWHEYLEALARDKRRQNRQQPYDSDDLRWLGRKLAPVKISAGGMALLAGRPDVLPILEAMLDELHIGYQLLDDLRDWKDDLAQNAWTLPLLAVRRQLGRPLTSDDVAKALWEDGLAVSIIHTAIGHLEQANQMAAKAGLHRLQSWIADLIHEVLPASDAPADRPFERLIQSPEIHIIPSSNGMLVFNVSNGKVYRTSQAAIDLARRLGKPVATPLTASERVLAEQLRSIGFFAVAQLPARPPGRPSLGLMLQPASQPGCTLKAHATPGSEDPLAPGGRVFAERAVQALLDASADAREARIMLMLRAWQPAIRRATQIAADARQRASEAGLTLHVHLLLLGTGATPEDLAALAEVGAYLRLTPGPVHAEEELAPLFALLDGLESECPNRLSVDLQLENYAGVLTNVLNRLAERHLSAIHIRSRRGRPLPPETVDLPALTAMKADLATLAESFAASVQGGRALHLANLLRPVLQIFAPGRVSAPEPYGLTLRTHGLGEGAYACLAGLAPADLLRPNVREFFLAGSQDIEAFAGTGAKDPCTRCWARYLCGHGDSRNTISPSSLGAANQCDCDLTQHVYELAVGLGVQLKPHLDRLAQIDPEELVDSNWLGIPDRIQSTA